MNSNVAQCAATLQDLFTNYADQAARETGFVQRQRKLSGATFAQTLTFAWLENPSAALEDLRDVASTLNVDVSCQALDQRLRPQAVGFMSRMLHEATQRVFGTCSDEMLPLLQRFQGVYVFDSSTISLPASLAGLLPGCGGSTPDDGQAACKIQLCVELSRGCLEDLVLLDGRAKDLQSPVAHRPLPAGALRLADLGFFDLGLLQRYSDEGVFWVSRLHSGTRISTADCPLQPLLNFVRGQHSDRIDTWVYLGHRRLPARLLVVRVPEEVANRRRQKLRRKAVKKGRGPSAERLALCDWDILITNVPVERLSLEEARALQRVRWQIELLFRVWKSEGRIDELRGQKPCRVLCEFYAKLLAMVVQHWLLLVCAGISLRYSHRRGARRVRRIALTLMSRLGSLIRVVTLLMSLEKQLVRLRITPRCRQPATFQLLGEAG